MSELPDGLSIAGLYAYPDPQTSEVFFYFPEVPVPETDADRHPTLSLLRFDQTSILQFGVRWAATSEQLDALQTALHTEFPNRPHLQLSPAPIMVDRVTVSLTDETGQSSELKTVSASNYPPYTALFNLTLDAQATALAIAAIMGRSEVLTVSYGATLSMPISVEIQLSGNVQTDLQQLPKSPSLSVCLAQIERAIAAGRLQRSVHGSDDPILLKNAERQVKEKAAKVLQTMAMSRPADRADLKATVALTEMASLKLMRSTDLGTWFPDGDGVDFMQTIAA